MFFIGNDEGGFYNVVDGEKSLVGDGQTTPAIADADYHDYRLVRSGTTVTAYIDGTEYYSLTDASLGTEGKIGFGSYNDIVYFDDFIEGVLETNFENLIASITDAQDKADNAEIGEEDGQYLQEVVDALQAAIAVAQAVADDTEAEQEAVDGAGTTLLDAIGVFLEGVNGVYFGKLSGDIDAAQAKVDAAVEGIIKGEYEEGAKAEFQAAIDAANAILENTEATQEEVNAAVDALTAAEEIFDSKERTVGINDVSQIRFNMYPNPVDNVLYIKTENEMQEITILNVVGQKIKTRNNIQSGSIKINTSDLKKGIYFIRIYDYDSNVVSGKFIKK